MVKSKRAREAADADEKPVDRVEVEAAPPKKRKRTDDATDAAAAAAEVKKAKKEKKDKKHKKESRKERKEKRKDLQDLPEQEEEEEEEDAPMADAEPAAEAEEDKASKKAKKEKKDKKKVKKEKKESKSEEEAEKPEEPAAAAATTNGDADEGKKKSKKDKKDKKKDKKAKKASDEGVDKADDKADDKTEEDQDGDDKKDRHIVFVGNLPFTATADTISAHFASLSPASVRCMSDPNDAQKRPCRGFAFVEFSKVWHMRTCLDKFHHSMFEDGESPARRINVELTAGGGGKTKQRQDKIRAKNEKLNENRTKRIEREKQVKEEGTSTAQLQHLEDSIHPSRRARVPADY